MAAELSLDIISFHILPRLPAKSIVRFKCVSKGWQSFLTTPMFANMHLHHQHRHKLLVISNTRSSCTFSTIDCESPEDGITAPRNMPIKVDSPGNMSVITSLNRLVCVGVKDHGAKNENSDLVLWNPSTGDYRILSKTNAHKECYDTQTRASVLYYISSEDDYKLLRVTNSYNGYLYSLKSDLWRKLESTENFHHWISEHCASLNGKLYFLEDDEDSVISLDLKTEKFFEVATPFSRDSRTKCLGFTVLRGCIHVWMHHHSNLCRKTELWRMDGDGDGWTKVDPLVFPVDWCACGWCLQPLYLMSDGNWLICQKNSLICITDPKDPLSFTRVVTDMGAGIPSKGKYLETLVSPNQYLN